MLCRPSREGMHASISHEPPPSVEFMNACSYRLRADWWHTSSRSDGTWGRAHLTRAAASWGVSGQERVSRSPPSAPASARPALRAAGWRIGCGRLPFRPRAGGGGAAAQHHPPEPAPAGIWHRISVTSSTRDAPPPSLRPVTTCRTANTKGRTSISAVQSACAVVLAAPAAHQQTPQHRPSPQAITSRRSGRHAHHRAAPAHALT